VVHSPTDLNQLAFGSILMILHLHLGPQWLYRRKKTK